MYFLSERDPNYTIKGSRDPLGFQVIWQSIGRELIPNLSTVSNDIMDFQIISLAHACKEEFKIADFRNFFLVFEQLMAYTRFHKDPSIGFNGIEKVRKKIANKITIGSDNQILSNQTAYGIWGKYNRPYTDMGFLEQKGFIDLFIHKLKQYPSLYKKIQALINNSKSSNTFDRTQLDEWKAILDVPSDQEHVFFVEVV